MLPLPYAAPDREALLADLNPAQREAVTHPGGPLLVVAGAGTGKTRVLTRRVAWLVAGGLPGRAVLAITFTNKAAGVLKARLGALPGAHDVWAGTFHAFGASLLRARGRAIGVDPGFTVLDREDQRRLLRDLLEDLGPEGRGWKPFDVAAMLSYEKNGGQGPRPAELSLPDLEAAFGIVREAYERRLEAASLLDFDDLLGKALRLLEADEPAREHYRSRFAHVLVDEYQDTNLVQARLLAALLSPARNLTVVGDPDQSIYRWRGAAIRNILDFEKDFPGARIVVLEQNYRTTGRILAAAEHVIAENVHRHAKRLFTAREAGRPLLEIVCADADDEAEAIADLLEAWRGDGARLEEMAVFYRVNALSRAIEMALRRRQVPYVVVAGLEFFQRREVKDVLAYARLVENPDDDAAFLRVANVPRRGLGQTSLRRIRLAALEAGTSCLAAVTAGVAGLSRPARRGLEGFAAWLAEVRALPRAPVAPILDRLAERSGYRAWLAEQGDRDEFARGRGENVDELIAFAHDVDRDDPQAGLGAFLERTALVADQDGYQEEGGRVTLMSVHAAKGLEFRCVVVAGAENDLFPHARSVEEPSGLEEERRLFYVGLTRAKEHLAVTHASRRMTYRGSEPRVPSPFLAAVPDALRERRFRAGAAAPALRPLWDLPANDGPEGVVREAGLGFAVGERVVHPYFGEGVLADLQGRGEDARVTVHFEQHGVKRLLLRHARLERVP